MDGTILSARILLGLIFALSAVGKIGSPGRFAEVIREHALLPRRFDMLSVVLVIIGEVVAAASLLTGLGARFGLAIAFLLLLVFMFVMLRNARRDQPLPCYCFGIDDSAVQPRRTLARLALLLVVTLFAIYRGFEEASSITAEPTLGTLFLALAVMVLGMWLLRTQELLALHRTSVPRSRTGPRRISLRESPLQPVKIYREGRDPR